MNVAERKQQASALEQKGEVTKAIAAYRQILEHLEGSPAILRELPLYVKLGDLCHKQGDGDEAAAMYNRAAETYAEHGSAKSVAALCQRMHKVAPESGLAHQYYAGLMLRKGHVAATRKLLIDFAKRSNSPSMLEQLKALGNRVETEVAPELKKLLKRKEPTSEAVELTQSTTDLLEGAPQPDNAGDALDQSEAEPFTIDTGSKLEDEIGDESGLESEAEPAEATSDQLIVAPRSSAEYDRMLQVYDDEEDQPADDAGGLTIDHGATFDEGGVEEGAAPAQAAASEAPRHDSPEAEQVQEPTEDERVSLSVETPLVSPAKLETMEDTSRASGPHELGLVPGLHLGSAEDAEQRHRHAPDPFWPDTSELDEAKPAATNAAERLSGALDQLSTGPLSSGAVPRPSTAIGTVSSPPKRAPRRVGRGGLAVAAVGIIAVAGGLLYSGVISLDVISDLMTDLASPEAEAVAEVPSGDDAGSSAETAPAEDSMPPAEGLPLVTAAPDTQPAGTVEGGFAIPSVVDSMLDLVEIPEWDPSELLPPPARVTAQAPTPGVGTRRSRPGSGPLVIVDQLEVIDVSPFSTSGRAGFRINQRLGSGGLAVTIFPLEDPTAASARIPVKVETQGDGTMLGSTRFGPYDVYVQARVTSAGMVALLQRLVTLPPGR